MKLSRLLDVSELLAEIDGGYVTGRRHPDDDDLVIYNYTKKAQYEGRWNAITTTCRGLIVHGDEVVARPFPKFFNYGEHEEGSLDLDAPCEVTDKLDGSLGILYMAPDGRHAIATRGSFSSDQAIEGTRILREKYADFVPCSVCTFVFEIVYPENRIVLDYGDQRDLVLLGSIDTIDGEVMRSLHAGPEWPGPSADIMSAGTLREALALPPRPNAEGVVVRFLDGDRMVKLKQDDYVALHRLVTGLNERTVWEHLAAGKSKDDLIAELPEEFEGWVRNVAGDLQDRFDEAMSLAHAAYDEVLVALMDRGVRIDLDDENWARDFRREFAAETRIKPDSGLLFSLLDGRDISPAIWKTLRPSGNGAKEAA